MNKYLVRRKALCRKIRKCECSLRNNRSKNLAKFLKIHLWWTTILLKLLSRTLDRARLNQGRAICIIWALFKKTLLLVLNLTNISRYLDKAFQEDNRDTAFWIRNINNMLELYDQGNLIQNIFKIFGVNIGHTCTANSRNTHFKKNFECSWEHFI